VPGIWTRKQRFVAYAGVALGTTVGYASFRLIVYLGASIPLLWLRVVVVPVVVILGWVLPIVVPLAFSVNFYCGVTKESLGDPTGLFESLLLPAIKRRLIGRDAEVSSSHEDARKH
jgi:hypothetical protein